MKLIVKIRYNLLIVFLSISSLGLANFDSDQELLKKSFEQFENNYRYFVVDIDLNKDGVLDKLVSSQEDYGNELYFFLAIDNKYELVLKSINFSQDGGRIIGDITPLQDGNDVLTIKTFFPKGVDIATYYIGYENNVWVLTKTVYETVYWQSDYTRRYFCEVAQNLPMLNLCSDSVQRMIKPIPPESERACSCETRFYIETNLSDFIKRFEHENIRLIDDIERYQALFLKFPLAKNTVVDYNNIAYYLEKYGAYKESIFVLNKVIKKFPKRIVAYINLGDAYWGLKIKEDAIVNYQKYIELMRASSKEAKIPRRVFERIKE